MRRLKAAVSVLFTTFLVPAAFGSLNASAWIADLETDEGQLNLLSSVADRHPTLLGNLSQHGQDGILLLQGAVPMLRKLRTADRRKALTVEEGTTTSLRGTLAGAAMSFEPVPLGKLKGDLERRLRATLDRGGKFTTLTEDLVQRPFASRAERVDFLAVAPLIYEPGGRAREIESVNHDSISNIDDNELELRLGDAWTEHLRPMVEAAGQTAWDEALQSLENAFLSKIARPGLRRVTVGDQKQAFDVTLEEVPKIVALLRGPIGYDCSSSTVPYYALLPGTRVFWIHRGPAVRSQPAGYLLMTEIEHDGRIVPYILTVNGSTLTAADARGAALQIAAMYDTDSLLVSREPLTINSEALREGLWSTDPRGETRQPVRLPVDWDFIGQSRRDSYYAGSKLSEPRLIDLDPSEIALKGAVRKLPSLSRYRPANFTELGRLDRALVATSLRSPPPSIPSEDIEMAGALLGTIRARKDGLDVESFRKLVDHFDVEPRRILHFLTQPARLLTLGRLWAAEAFDLIGRGQLLDQVTKAKNRWLEQREQIFSSRSRWVKEAWVRVLLLLPDIEGTFDYRRRRYTRDLADPDLLPTLGFVERWTRAQRRLTLGLFESREDDQPSSAALDILSNRERLNRKQARWLAGIARSLKHSGMVTERAAFDLGRKVNLDTAGLKLIDGVAGSWNFPLRGVTEGLLDRDDLTPDVWDLLERRHASSDKPAPWKMRGPVLPTRDYIEREMRLLDVVADCVFKDPEYWGNEFLKRLLQKIRHDSSREFRAAVPRLARRFTALRTTRVEAYTLLAKVGGLSGALLEAASRDDEVQVRAIAASALLERADPAEWPLLERLSVDQSYLVVPVFVDFLKRATAVGDFEAKVIRSMSRVDSGRSALIKVLESKTNVEGWPREALLAVREQLEEGEQFRVHHLIVTSDCGELLEANTNR